jgi:hypothetical protein
LAITGPCRPRLLQESVNAWRLIITDPVRTAAIWHSALNRQLAAPLGASLYNLLSTMPGIWPHDTLRRATYASDESLRPFHCVMLTPFDSPRFEDLARELERIVRDYTERVLPTVQIGPAIVERLDWVNAAGTIQHQIWDRISKADLIFCDLTGQNPNVMFEAGVCAGWKRVEQVIFIRDAFYRPDQPFDIAPFRYVKYRMTTDGLPVFEETLKQLVVDVVIRFPDRDHGSESAAVDLPLEIDFSGNRDDRRLVTPPLAHRRVRDGLFEFGSLWSYPHSWATIGRIPFSTFKLQFVARFAKLHPNKERGFIGVGFRSHNVLVPFCHVVYLNRDGRVIMAQPDDAESEGYRDIDLRDPQAMQLQTDHHFTIALTDTTLTVDVDDCHRQFPVADMPKLLSPGPIRLQSHLAWMGIRHLSLSSA